MGTEDVVHMPNVILPSYKEEQNNTICKTRINLVIIILRERRTP